MEFFKVSTACLSLQSLPVTKQAWLGKIIEQSNQTTISTRKLKFLSAYIFYQRFLVPPLIQGPPLSLFSPISPNVLSPVVFNPRRFFLPALHSGHGADALKVPPRSPTCNSSCEAILAQGALHCHCTRSLSESFSNHRTRLLSLQCVQNTNLYLQWLMILPDNQDPQMSHILKNNKKDPNNIKLCLLAPSGAQELPGQALISSFRFSLLSLFSL